MKSEKKAFWQRMLAKMLVAAMVLSMTAAIPVGATGGGAEDTANVAGASAGGGVDGDSSGGGAEENPTQETVSATLGSSFSGVTVYRVEIDEKEATEASTGTYTATVNKNETHTATALIRKADGTYGTVSGSGSVGESPIGMSEFKAIEKKTATGETVTLNATSENTIAQDGKLLVTWDALGGTSNTTKYTLGRNEDVATQTENGVLFTTPGSVTVTKESFVPGDTIAAASLTETPITLEVKQKQLTKNDVAANVTPVQGTVDSEITITVAVSLTGVDNYTSLHGDVSYVLSENSKNYAMLTGNTLKITKAKADSNAEITLDVTVAESAFFGKVEVTSNDVLAVRKTDTIGLNDRTTDADVLHQKGVTLPERSTGGQTITYSVLDNTGNVIKVEGNKLSISEDNLTAAAKAWTLQATVPGNEYYGSVTETKTLTVAAGAQFEKTPDDLTWLSDELTPDTDGNRTYTNTISATDTWTYSITAVVNHNGNEVEDLTKWSDTATVDGTTGKVTMKTAGAVTVTATREDGIQKSYTLKVWKAALAPLFSPATTTLTYGAQDSYTLPLKVKFNDQEIDVPKDAEIQWTVSNNTLGASAPDAKFKTTLANQSENGSVKFTAAVKGDTHYYAASESTAEFILNVSFAAKFEASYKTSSPNGENNWYVPSEETTAAQNVVFTANEGYQLSTTGVLNDATAWATTLTLADIVGGAQEENADLGKNAVLYVRKTASGAIAKIQLPGYQVDNTAPTMTVEYSQPVSTVIKEAISYIFFNKKENDSENLTITVTATEETSGIASISWGKLDGGNAVEYIDFDAGAGFESGKEYSFKMNTVEDFSSALSFKIVDKSGQATIINDRANEFVVIDSIAPEISVSYGNIVRKCVDGKYLENNDTSDVAQGNVSAMFAQNDVMVTIKVAEENFKADRFQVEVKKNGIVTEEAYSLDETEKSVTLTLPKDAGKETVYNLVVSGTDLANNEIKEYTECGRFSNGVYTSCDIVIDDRAPVVTISYDQSNLKAYVDANEQHTEKGQATTAVYSGTVVATVSVEEQYFDSSDCDIQIKTSKEATVEWNGNVATVTIPAKKTSSEDIYAIAVDGTDIARHPFTYSDDTDFGTVEKSRYVSKELLIDTMEPRIAIDYTNEKNAGAVDGFFTGRSAAITVEDASFDPSVERVTVTAVNAKGTKVDVKGVQLGDWQRDEQNANQWTNAIDFKVEGNYTFVVSIEDNAEHQFKKAAVTKDEGQHIFNEDGTYRAQFTVDNTTPAELKVTYSEHISTAILNGITFGFYSKNQPLKLNIETVDNISGVQHMSFTYHREADASAVNADTLTVPYDYKKELNGYTLGAASVFESEAYDGSDKQLRGQFDYVVMDYAGNVLSNTDQDDANHENGQIGEIVDSISPTATITYSGAVNSSTASNNENPNGVLAYYFNTSELTVPIKITEANFIPDDVHVSVRRNSESDSAFEPVNVTWSATGKQDEYVGYITLGEPESYYNIKVEYADHSENPMQMTDTINSSYDGTESYVSPRLVLDTTAPVVSVSYAGSYRSGEMDFYSTTAVATIRVKEKNFCAEEATEAITIRGQNIDGTATNVPSVSSWSYIGDDAYTATITYDNDSRYTFDMNYSDLAKLRQATTVEKTFAVDKTAPSNLNISYSTDVWGTAAGSILWYDAPVQVMLTAYDVTAGVETITYSYPTKAGVSSVNVGMSDVSVSVNAATSSVEYSFSIPSSVLIRTNQFNGTVNFTAVDRSGNSTSFNGTNELVVDNIAPNATITYTTPVSSDETADYYDKDFEAHIEINEANFDASNVHIDVVKDGAPYTDFSYSFTDESVDVHVATLHFSENGEYIIQVEYTDQSKNQMVDEAGETEDGRYTSRIKTIDKTQPAITITDMMGRENPNQIAYDRNNEDSKGNKHTSITFTVSVEDDHLLEEGIEVSLRGFEPQKDETDLKTYTYVDETAHYVSAAASVLEAGKAYAVSIENIENDAVYFLNCSATDQSGNLTTCDIKFSVNRDGSTYYVEEAPGEDNEGYTNTQSEAIIHEISVEPLSKTDVTVVRDSTSQVLKQDEEYGVNSEAGQDENWNDYTYTVYADNFKTDGVYAVQTNSVTEQKEQGGTEQISSSANNDEAAIRFVMDTVAPEAYISGVVEGGQYQTNEQPITITISDNTMLASAKLSIDNDEEAIDLSEGFDGTYATAISAKNHDQVVRVQVTDKAGNEYELSMDGIRVSTNIFFLHWEIFVVCGVALLIMIAILIGVIVSRKKKRTTANV